MELIQVLYVPRPHGSKLSDNYSIELKVED